MKKLITIILALSAIFIIVSCDKLPFIKREKEDPELEILIEPVLVQEEESTIRATSNEIITNDEETEKSTKSNISMLTNKRETDAEQTDAYKDLYNDAVDHGFKIVGSNKYTIISSKDVYYEQTTINNAFNPADNIGNTYTYSSFRELDYGNKKWKDIYYLKGSQVEWATINKREERKYTIENVVNDSVYWEVSGSSDSETLSNLQETRENNESTTKEQQTTENTDKIRFDDFDNIKLKETKAETKSNKNNKDPNVLTYEQRHPYLFNFKFETKVNERIPETMTVKNVETISNSSSIARNIVEGTTGATTVSLQANSKRARLFNVQGYTIKVNSATEVMYVNNKDNNMYMSLSFGSNSILLSKIQNKSRMISIYGNGIISLINPPELSSPYAMDLKHYMFVPDNSTERIFSHAIVKIDNTTSLLILNESGMKDGNNLASAILKAVEITMG